MAEPSAWLVLTAAILKPLTQILQDRGNFSKVKKRGSAVPLQMKVCLFNSCIIVWPRGWAVSLELDREIVMLIRNSVYGVALFLFASGIASAGECVLHVTRTACPGQEKVSFSKCNGAQSCDEKKSAASAAQCAAKAKKEGCANSRYEITKYKKVTAEYDGVAVDGGKDFCVGHPDFPYANKPDCKR
jgi:hypothetical protein